VLVPDTSDCYAVLGIVHARWNPLLGRFKDYVAVPKFNLYQSLHTTVIGPRGKPVEIQIRTYDMHRRAEYGVAAHWKYKEDGRAGRDTDQLGDLDDMKWVAQLADWQSEYDDPSEYLDTLRTEMRNAPLYVFTPKGKVISLPNGSTPVDFAYGVHTEVGNHTIGARVNGRLVSLSSQLEMGDIVEVFTKPDNAGPSRDWLNFVKSPRARSKIKQRFTKERREEAIETGKESIARLMRKEGVGLKRVLTHESLSLAAAYFRLADVDALYAAVGENHISAQAVVRRVITLHGGEDGAREDMSEAVQITRRGQSRNLTGGDSGVVVTGQPDVWVKLAKCCTPVPPDEILGFVTKGGGVSVHRVDCTNAGPLLEQEQRVLPVEWVESADAKYLVNIQVEAMDRQGLLSDITKALSDIQVNILSAQLTTSRDRKAISRYTFELADASHLNGVLAAVRNVPDVFDAYRVTH
jgi:guanosine-3',5'-bis(diphosphate) 3'-pyrophosphohydrolase